MGIKKLDNLASLVAAQFEDFVVMIFKKNDFFKDLKNNN